MQSLGIDYGNGMTNRNHESGIRYGVIHQQELEFFFDSVEADYGEPHCPECGGDAVDASELTEKQEENYKEYGYGCMDYACHDCEITFDSENAFPEEPLGWNLEDGEYKMELGSDCIDIFVTRSPYYTYARFCSPCAPGACYLLDSIHLWEDSKEDYVNNRAYCPGVEWFSSENPCPYQIYSVETGECLYKPFVAPDNDELLP